MKELSERQIDLVCDTVKSICRVKKIRCLTRANVKLVLQAVIMLNHAIKTAKEKK